MRLLDLFCGAGGAAMGYHNAGFAEIVGVDIEPQPNYPFRFIQADATTFLPGGFDLIHASPPCQEYSAFRHMNTSQPELIGPIREMLLGAGTPWVIENVPGAPLLAEDSLFGGYGKMLCGTMFGLRVWRHRLFETSFPLPMPPQCDHSEPAMNPHNTAGRDRIYAEFGKQDPDPIWNAELGVPWMGRYEGREAIPPAYTEWIGKQFLANRTDPL